MISITFGPTTLPRPAKAIGDAIIPTVSGRAIRQSIHATTAIKQTSPTPTPMAEAFNAGINNQILKAGFFATRKIDMYFVSESFNRLSKLRNFQATGELMIGNPAIVVGNSRSVIL